MGRKSFCGILPLKSRKRLLLLFIFLLFLFCLLLIQFYRIQIIEGEKWSKKASAQHHLTLTEPCKRGAFYSNTDIKEGHPESPVAFVFDVAAFHLYIDTTVFSEPLKTVVFDKLQQILQVKEEDLHWLKKQIQTKSRGRKLASWLSQEQREAIERWWFPFARQEKVARNALFFLQEFKRSYPYGKMLGQLLHTVREDRDPKTNDLIPTGGLELTMDRYLKGKEGKRKLLRSPRSPLDFGELLVEPQDGADVYLTVNHYLQAIVEEEVEKAVIRSNSKSGWAIMMDPYSGQILAWAQYPWFDPSRYRDFFNDPAKIDETKCKGVTDPFEPGSTFKPITIFVCLKANEELKKRGEKPLFFPLEKVSVDNGSFPGRSKPIKDTKKHYNLNMYMALQKSSNIYMSRMVQRIIDRLGTEWYRNCLSEVLGFGHKTGIEIPSESAGVLPTPGKKQPNGTLEWSKSTPFSMAFGHNILTNSLQMIRVYAMLANGGYPVTPTIVKKISRKRKEGGELIVWECPKRAENVRPLLPKESMGEILKGLKYVTKPGGSATKADIFGYTEIGKTSTSEKIVNGTYSKKDHISTFIGWAPADNPRFVLMVVMDEPEFKYIPGIGKNQMGGNCAAPAFGEIGRRTLSYLGVAPDDPFGYPKGDPRRDETKAVWLKEAKELTEQYNAWNYVKSN